MNVVMRRRSASTDRPTAVSNRRVDASFRQNIKLYLRTAVMDRRYVADCQQKSVTDTRNADYRQRSHNLDHQHVVAS